METNIRPVPLRDFPSWLRSRNDVFFAPKESTGSRTRIGEAHLILVVEDDLLIATQIETAMAEEGFDILGIATTSEEAIEMVAKNPPDLAIMDIRLAGDKDGLDTALELFRTYGIRCIFTSAYSDDEARQRAEPAAPLGWLQKPYTMASLLGMVRTAANKLRGKDRRQ